MDFLPLKEEVKAQEIELDEEEKEAIRISEQNRSIIIGSLITAFFIGLLVQPEHNYLLSEPIVRISNGLGSALGILLFAGIPSAIVSRFSRHWRFTWLVASAVLIISQIVVWLYDK